MNEYLQWLVIIALVLRLVWVERVIIQSDHIALVYTRASLIVIYRTLLGTDPPDVKL